MQWRRIHRWLGLWAGALALIVGVSGAVLAFFPLRDAWRAEPVPTGLTVADLARGVADHVPGVEELRRLPAGEVVAYSFDGNQARARRIDPADGTVLGDYQASGVQRWFRNLHRSFFLGDAGRLGVAGLALAMLLLSVSGTVMLARRLGGWRRLVGRVRGTSAQRVHAVAGRILVLILAWLSLTALYMSATTFGLIPADSGFDPDVLSAPGDRPDLPVEDLPLLRSLPADGLRKLTFPAADDPGDVWVVSTDRGAGWIDRRSGHVLAWEPASVGRQVQEWAHALHTGQGLWAWALILGLAGSSLPAFWVSGLLIWRQGRGRVPRLRDNRPARRADILIFVASEGGTTWGFAQALHEACARNGHAVHTAALERFEVPESARQVFVLAATYGEGQAPAHATRALDRITGLPLGSVPVTVLGFGDRQFPAFCAYAEAVERVLRGRGWSRTLPLECIHQQSAQQFERWGVALSRALGETLVLDYVPRVPPSVALELIGREEYVGGANGPTVVLRFRWSDPGWVDRLRGRGMPRFEAGDLVGVVPPASPVPRYYSLASSRRDGFLEICVRRLPGGVCSGFLHGLEPGERVRAFIKPNPGFTLEGGQRPVALIGAGTGVAPLAGFIRDNIGKVPMFLYFGARHPAEDFYFGEAIRGWLADGRLSGLVTAFSRVPDGGGYVQDALRRDADRLRALVSEGAALRVCGSRPMAAGVAEALDDILGAIGLDVRRLREGGRYAEDVF
ncbi:PepSY domain-containing protein [Castellaniella sp. GW247-6E4]|uniref:PepSY domain-containing protein n=1 Tax=Castellaniella sp. GW247-6E4 TaxID=3140380 RepID=UPI003315086A